MKRKTHAPKYIQMPFSKTIKCSKIQIVPYHKNTLNAFFSDNCKTRATT